MSTKNNKMTKKEVETELIKTESLLQQEIKEVNELVILLRIEKEEHRVTIQSCIDLQNEVATHEQDFENQRNNNSKNIDRLDHASSEKDDRISELETELFNLKWEAKKIVIGVVEMFK